MGSKQRILKMKIFAISCLLTPFRAVDSTNVYRIERQQDLEAPEKRDDNVNMC
jgi:hypothetical protein